MGRNMEKAANKIHLLDPKVGESEFRYERKFVYTDIQLEDLIQELFLNSFCFKEIYSKRQVNNIYFDDNDFSFYRQNVVGVGNRLKYRLRWYGNEFYKIKNPTIEIKNKQGDVGSKIKHKLTDFDFDLNDIGHRGLQHKMIGKLDDNVYFKNIFQLLQPTIFNSYERRYFLSFCERYRVTLDFNQSFFNPNSANYADTQRRIDNSIIILELKYDVKDDDDSRTLTQQFRSRVSKNSKYVQGIDFINNSL